MRIPSDVRPSIETSPSYISFLERARGFIQSNEQLWDGGVQGDEVPQALLEDCLITWLESDPNPAATLEQFINQEDTHPVFLKELLILISRLAKESNEIQLSAKYQLVLEAMRYFTQFKLEA